MDLDRAIEFLLAEGARLDARLAEQHRRQDQFDQQLRVMAQLGMRMTRRAFAAIEALTQSDVRRGAELDTLRLSQAENDAQIKELARQLKIIIRQGGNGNKHPPR